MIASIANVVPSKVKSALSSNSPEAPAITTLLSVRSLTCAESSVAPLVTTKPLEILALLLISTAPAKVDAPATLTSSNSVCPSTSSAPLASRVPVIVVTPVTSAPPPTNRFFAKPTPPANLSAPVEELYD